MTDLEAITASLEHWRDNLRLLADGEVVIPRHADDCALCSEHFSSGLFFRCQTCPFDAIGGCVYYWDKTDPELCQKTRIIAAANLVAQLYTMQQEYLGEEN